MDTIRFYCGKCGKKLEAKAVDAGGAVKCPKCGVRLPIPGSNLDRAQIRLFCVKCGARLRAWPNEAGKQVECRRCKKLIALPHIEDMPKEEPEGDRVRKPRDRKNEPDLIGLAPDEDDEIEKEEIKIEPVRESRKTRGAEKRGMLNFADADDEILLKKKKQKPAQRQKDKDEGEEMIRLDEFLVEDTARSKKKRLFEEEEKLPRPKFTADEMRQAQRDTDALPPSKPRPQKLSTPSPSIPRGAGPSAGKTLVVECKKCGMRLVFKDRKPVPARNAQPAAGHWPDNVRKPILCGYA